MGIIEGEGVGVVEECCEFWKVVEKEVMVVLVFFIKGEERVG